MPPKDLLQGPSVQMEKSVLWRAELSAQAGQRRSVRPSWVSARTGFLELASSVALSAMAAWDNGAHICLCQPADSGQWLGTGRGAEGMVGRVSPAGSSPEWGDLTGGPPLCVLHPQPPGAQRNQVHSPGSLLSLQKAAEDVSASPCFLRVSRGGRETPGLAGHSPGQALPLPLGKLLPGGPAPEVAPL